MAIDAANDYENDVVLDDETNVKKMYPPLPRHKSQISDSDFYQYFYFRDFILGRVQYYFGVNQHRIILYLLS